MVEVLQFALSGFWNFIGSLILLAIVFCGPFMLLAEGLERLGEGLTDIGCGLRDFARGGNFVEPPPKEKK